MSLEVVNQVFATGGFDLRTKDGCGRFTEAVVRTLRQKDDGWGHIRKHPPQNSVQDSDGNFHAVDALMYRDGHVFDIVIDSESLNARAAWQDKGFTDPALWFAPSGAVAPPIPPIAEPAPPAPPPAPPLDLSPLQASFDQLAADVRALSDRFGAVSAESAMVRAVVAEVLAKVSQPLPAFTGKFAFTSAMRFVPEDKK